MDFKFKSFCPEARQGGLEFCFASSQLHGRHEVRPLIPLFKSPVCLQLRDEARVKHPRALEVYAMVLRTACG